jgi:hypothetical protein
MSAGVNRVASSIRPARRLNPNNQTRRPGKAASPVGQGAAIMLLSNTPAIVLT